MSDDDLLTTEMGQVLFKQMLDVFITPEVVRRQDAGLLPKPLDLHRAQIVCYPDGRPNDIRINDEVRALLKVRVTREVSPGSPVYVSDFDAIESIKLGDSDDPDAGHITMFRRSNGTAWFIAFDFIYNRALAQGHLKTGGQFLTAARRAKEEGAWSVCVDNLFSAAELASKAFLLTMPDPEFRKKTNHKTIQSRINQQARLGNLSTEFRSVFNSLASMRYDARYLGPPMELPVERADSMIAIVETFFEQMSVRLQRDHPTDPT